VLGPFDGLRLNLVGRTPPGIGTAASRQPTIRPYIHVLLARDLAAESNAADSLRSQDVLFSDGHFGRLAVHELDSAGRASSLATAGMELVNACLVFQSQDQSLAGRDFKFSNALYR